MITREQVADLQPGDVVELTDERWAKGTVLRGAVYVDGNGCLLVGHLSLVNPLGGLYLDRPRTTLTVISRAPRPLYVNHPRTEPVAGDVAKDAAGNEPSGHTWHCLGDDESGLTWWRFVDRMRNGQPKTMRLLVDGETGQVTQ